MNNYKSNFPQQNHKTEKVLKTNLRDFSADWIKKEIDAYGVNFCDQVAQDLADGDVSSSFIRNIYGELKRIEVKGFDQCRADFYLLRPKVAYATARNDKKAASLFKDVYNKMAECVSDNKTFCNLVRMTEAIIAYHKTYHNK